jgi:hypothetical protein
VIVVSNPSEFAERIRGDAFPPVMSYVDPTKETTSGVNFIEQQRVRYEALIMEARTVAVIGVAVRPDDKHMWEPLEKTDAEIMYVAGSSAGKKFSAWSAQRRPTKHGGDLAQYFGDAFERCCHGIGLAPRI